MSKQKMIKGAGIIIGRGKIEAGPSGKPAAVKEISADKRDSVMGIIKGLETRMDRIEKRRAAVEKKRSRGMSSDRAKMLVEEIHIPSLESVKAQARKK